jgi:hypothetical protein
MRAKRVSAVQLIHGSESIADEQEPDHLGSEVAQPDGVGDSGTVLQANYRLPWLSRTNYLGLREDWP